MWKGLWVFNSSVNILQWSTTEFFAIEDSQVSLVRQLLVVFSCFYIPPSIHAHSINKSLLMKVQVFPLTWLLTSCTTSITSSTRISVPLWVKAFHQRCPTIKPADKRPAKRIWVPLAVSVHCRWPSAYIKSQVGIMIEKSINPPVPEWCISDV